MKYFMPGVWFFLIALGLSAANLPESTILWGANDRRQIDALAAKISTGDQIFRETKFCRITMFGGSPQLMAQTIYMTDAMFRQFPKMLNVGSAFRAKNEVFVYRSRAEYLAKSKAPDFSAGVCGFKRNVSNTGWIPQVHVYQEKQQFNSFRSTLTHELVHGMTRQLILQDGVKTPSLAINEGLAEFFRYWNFCAGLNPRGNTSSCKAERNLRRKRSHFAERVAFRLKENKNHVPTVSDIIGWSDYNGSYSYEISEAFIDFLFSEPEAAYFFGRWVMSIKMNKPFYLDKKRSAGLEENWRGYVRKLLAGEELN